MLPSAFPPLPSPHPHLISQFRNLPLTMIIQEQPRIRNNEWTDLGVRPGRVTHGLRDYE